MFSACFKYIIEQNWLGSQPTWYLWYLHVMFRIFAVNSDTYYTVLQYYYAHYKIFANESFLVAEIAHEDHIL